LVQVDAEVFGGKKCVGYIEQLEGVWSSQLPEGKGSKLTCRHRASSI